ncbi:T9SS type A sorting domain-containing protein [Flavobacterium dankookense]|uniref:Putative secreted protein (Por secretion system target) n=1 Tax=Flavobacterium dankookense TaxID=706186 RepID=A0A4R6Q726_9FLAO|nr:T9SS type A sorting domain-containing protein [Flavobacterium dankookense]TDP57807.1 putative secreted protein (Por secretion system target) [Flavobacterium dankookense]
MKKNYLLFCLLSFVLSYSQNDICANSISLTPNTNCVTTTGTFSGSSNTGTTTACSPTSLQDVWYSFIATDPTMSVQLTNGVGVNLGMEILSGSCAGSSFVCDNSSTSTSSEFYLNNNFTVGETYFIRVYHTEAVLLTTSFNICVQNPTLSIEENALNQFKIYPNPATDFIDIQYDGILSKVEIYDSIGKIVAKTDKNRIDISNLSIGIYLVKIVNQNGGVSTKRIIKK